MFNTPFHGNDLKCFPHQPLKYPPSSNMGYTPKDIIDIDEIYINGLMKIMEMSYLN